mgnify:CR=1 FL=1
MARLEHVNVTVADPRATAAVLQDLFGWHTRWEGSAINGGFTVHVGGDDSYLALYTGPAGGRDQVAADNSYLRRGGLNHIAAGGAGGRCPPSSRTPPGGIFEQKKLQGVAGLFRQGCADDVVGSVQAGHSDILSQVARWSHGSGAIIGRIAARGECWRRCARVRDARGRFARCRLSLCARRSASSARFLFHIACGD